jgi:hypothetical protein
MNTLGLASRALRRREAAAAEVPPPLLPTTNARVVVVLVVHDSAQKIWASFRGNRLDDMLSLLTCLLLLLEFNE